MVLESIMFCVDSSEHSINEDFLPSRLAAQIEAVSLLCDIKKESNVQNTIGLMTIADSPQVLATPTMDVNHVKSKLHLKGGASGALKFVTGLRIAHLALRNRMDRSQKQRIIAFVGSPIVEDEREMMLLAKRLKKEKVSVDVINFGETDNAKILEAFIGELGDASHFIPIERGPYLMDSIIGSPVTEMEASESGGHVVHSDDVDPNLDPELSMALRISMEEQRQRVDAQTNALAANASATNGAKEKNSAKNSSQTPNLEFMTDSEQLEYAIRLSLETSNNDNEDKREENSGGVSEADKPDPKQGKSESNTIEAKDVCACEQSETGSDKNKTDGEVKPVVKRKRKKKAETKRKGKSNKKSRNDNNKKDGDENKKTK